MRAASPPMLKRAALPETRIHTGYYYWQTCRPNTRHQTPRSHPRRKRESTNGPVGVSAFPSGESPERPQDRFESIPSFIATYYPLLRTTSMGLSFVQNLILGGAYMLVRPVRLLLLGHMGLVNGSWSGMGFSFGRRLILGGLPCLFAHMLVRTAPLIVAAGDSSSGVTPPTRPPKKRPLDRRGDQMGSSDQILRAAALPLLCSTVTSADRCTWSTLLFSSRALRCLAA